MVRGQVDLISRIRSASGSWDFYADEDVENGFIVFKNVKYFSMAPEGLFPNDLINYVSVEKDNQEGFLVFVLGIDSADEQGQSEEVQIRIVAESVLIERQDGLAVAE